MRRLYSTAQTELSIPRKRSERGNRLSWELREILESLKRIGACDDSIFLAAHARNLLMQRVAGRAAPAGSLLRLCHLMRRVARFESRPLPLTDNRRPEAVSVEAPI